MAFVRDIREGRKSLEQTANIYFTHLLAELTGFVAGVNYK